MLLMFCVLLYHVFAESLKPKTSPPLRLGLNPNHWSQAVVMHLDGVVGPANMHSYALSSGNFLVGLRSISAWADQSVDWFEKSAEWYQMFPLMKFHIMFLCTFCRDTIRGAMVYFELHMFLCACNNLKSNTPTVNGLDPSYFHSGVPVVLAASGKISGPSWQLVLGCDYRICSMDTEPWQPWQQTVIEKMKHHVVSSTSKHQVNSTN